MVKLPATPGRPRSLHAQRAVLDAARALIEEDGYPAATIDAIAARSKVAKTTIYRWWPNRGALVVELLVWLAGTAAPMPEGQDPVEALRTELRLVARASEQLPGRLLMALLGEAPHDPKIRAALAKQVFNPRRQATARVVRRAQDAGAMRSDVAPLLVVDLLFGPLFYRKYIRGEPVPEGFVSQVFESVMAGLAPRAKPAGRRPRRARA